MDITFFSLGPKVIDFYMHFCVSMAKKSSNNPQLPCQTHVIRGVYCPLGDMCSTPFIPTSTLGLGPALSTPPVRAKPPRSHQNLPFLHFDHQNGKIGSKTWVFLYSSVPVGYGLGSSGNLIAALYDGFLPPNPASNPICLPSKPSLAIWNPTSMAPAQGSTL